MTAPRRVLTKVLGYELRDVARSRWLLAYAGFFLIGTEALLRLSGTTANALLGLTNVVLVLVPLVSIVFGTMYLYHAREFTELLLAQPVTRRALFGGLYLGLALPLAAAFAAGVLAPFALHGIDDPAQRATLAVVVGVGAVLTFAFTALAFVIALRFEDRVKALGVAIAVWLAATALYDGVVLLLVGSFADYPLERPLLGLMMINPVDLARVLLLLRLDGAALMGYTGAVFSRFFGSTEGALLALGALALWIAVPVWRAGRRFARKDF